MRETTFKFSAIAAVLMLSFGLAACSGESGETAEGAGEAGMSAEAAGEHAEGCESREAVREGGEAEGEHSEAREGGEHEGEGEHAEAREGGEHEGEEGEEPGIYIARGDTWDMTRRGARLVLSFNAEQNAFVGTVENTTDQTMCAVRVEVHLAGGSELGPTPRTDVPAGGTTSVTLATEGESFETWTAHPELSRCSG